MSRRKPKAIRRQARPRHELSSHAMAVLLVGTASKSLDMDHDAAAQAHAVLTGANPSPTIDEADTAARVLARCCEILESRGYEHFGDVTIAELRNQLERARGPEFLSEVARTGEPARRAALRIASVLIALFIFLGAFPAAKAGPACSHKIHAVNFLARVLQAFKTALCTWLRGASGPQFSGGCRRRSRVGRCFARASSSGRARARRSLSGSISKRSTRTSSSAWGSLSSRFAVRTARSSAPLSSRRRGPLCVSSNVATADTLAGVQ